MFNAEFNVIKITNVNIIFRFINSIPDSFRKIHIRRYK